MTPTYKTALTIELDRIQEVGDGALATAVGGNHLSDGSWAQTNPTLVAAARLADRMDDFDLVALVSHALDRLPTEKRAVVAQMLRPDGTGDVFLGPFLS